MRSFFSQVNELWQWRNYPFLRNYALASQHEILCIGTSGKKIQRSGVRPYSSFSLERDFRIRLSSDADADILVPLIKDATDRGMEFYCRQIQSYTVKSGLGSDCSVSHALLKFYKECGCPNSAHQMFVENPHPQVVSWNALISCYLRCGLFSKALNAFVKLERSGLCGDAYSFTMAMSVCGRIGKLSIGSSIHCKVVKCGWECSLVVSNTLIDMYGKCGSTEEGIRAFSEIVNKDTISWNSVIAASVRNQRLDLASSFFSQMPHPDIISYNEMIEGFSQFGKMEDALAILVNMPSSNSSSWNSIITGYVNRKMLREALKMFAEMHSKSVGMDVYTYSVLLSGIADLPALTWGMIIHCFTVKCGLEFSVCVGSALIDMYSKCGHVGEAELIFKQMPGKNIVSWNAMISGYAHSSDFESVILLFEEMQMNRALKPDRITFLNLLTACSSSNVELDRAKGYFELMINGYGITPTVEHCCSMIRIMGRAGDAWGAKRLIYWLSFGACPVVWRALLGVCATCKDLKVAKIAASKIVQLEGEDDYLYVVLSNILSFYCKWTDVAKLRKVMRNRGVMKDPGRSWMEVEQSCSVAL